MSSRSKPEEGSVREKAQAHGAPLLVAASVIALLGLVAESSYRVGYQQALEDQGDADK